jgi:uncharacterized RmlC-like cupin family protein
MMTMTKNDPSTRTTSRLSKGCVVKTGSGYRAEQGSDYFPAVSAETIGSQMIWFGKVTIPPGGRTKAHVHEFHESAFFLLSGDNVELWTGDELQHCEVAHAGDYLFIPANVPHVAVNRGTEPAVCIGCRNEPTAQESVVMYPALDAKVP